MKKFFRSFSILMIWIVSIANKTSKPFITSDNPTIKYNSVSENYEWLTSSFVSSGLQIFLPLSPKLVLFFYDPKTYNVKTDIDDIILIEKESEVFQLNLLQVLKNLKYPKHLFYGGHYFI